MFRVCGTIFNAAAITAAHAAAVETACTWVKPFKWGVRFDAQEIQIETANNIIAANAFAANADTFNAGTAGEGFGYLGFYMAFWQRSC